MNPRKLFGWTTVVMTALLLGGLISMLDSTQAAPTMSEALVLNITDSSTAEDFVVDTKSKNTAISQVTVSNVRDASLSVSWITDQPMTGTVRYGTDPNNLNERAYDDRGADTSDDTHHVTISGLMVTTTYYIDVISGGTTDNNGGAHYSATTGPTLAVPSSDTVYGKVFKADGSTAAEGTIVYLTLQDNNGSGTSGQGALLSSLVENGFWSVNLGNARTSDLSGYFSYSASGDQLVIEAEGAGDGSATQTVDTASDNDAADMTLTIADSADLQVTSVDLPADIYAGYTIPITWTVRNAGSQATNVSDWNDRIYFSSDNTLDTNTDTMLATVDHSGTLAAGASYSAATSIDLPQDISGRPYLFVVTDYDDQVEEETKEGNNSTTKQIYIKMTVTSGSSGNNIGLNWPHMTHDSNGTPINVTYYEVWRSSEPYFTPGISSTLVTTVTAPTSLNRIVGSSRPANTMGYTDVDVMDDGNNYYYAIQAMGDSGAIETSNGAGKSTYPLTYGRYNTIALPLSGTGMNDAESLATYINTQSGATVSQMLKWEASLGTRGTFRTYKPGDPFSDNFSTATGDPYFVFFSGSGSGTFSLLGSVPTANSISFDLIGDANGCRYNFISLPPDQGALSDAQSLEGAIGDVSQLLTWDATLGTRGTFRTYKPGDPFSDNFSTQTGKAFFVCMQASKTWP